MMMYQIATNDHAMKIRPRAIGTSNDHFKSSLFDFVSFQILAADPENDVGAEMTTFSDANCLLTDQPPYVA